MAIQVIYTDETTEELISATFEQLQEIVGGYVECNHVMLNGKVAQALCNEDGLSMGLPHNRIATEMFRHKLNLDYAGAVGTWVILSDEDKLK